MAAEENPQKEFVIPTRYKTQVSSRLSWPIGAMELTKYLIGVPQLKELQLSFAPSYGAPQQGQWPIVFHVIEVRYAHPPLVAGDSDWRLNVFPVPRNMRAKIREGITLHGHKSIAGWLIDHAKFSGVQVIYVLLVIGIQNWTN